MPIYKYKALDPKGRSVEDFIEASNRQLAQSRLRNQNFYITELREDTAKRDRELFPKLANILYRVSNKEMGLFAKQLGTLLGAGIALNEALHDVWEQNNNPHFKKILGQMKEDVLGGKSLSQAIGEHPSVFPPVYKSMIQVGEATGSYETTLNRLADLEEKNADLKSKAITALVYPGIMFTVSIGVIIFLLTSVVPQLETMFANFEGAELPWITQFVLGLSDIFRKYWYLLILLVLGSIAGFQSWQQTDKGKVKWDTFRLKIPLFGKVQSKIIISRFSRNLGILLDSNVPLLNALEIVSDTVNSPLFSQEIKTAIKDINEGSSLKEALKDSAILTHLVKGMMSAGEASDQLSDVLNKVADIMEAEVDASVKGLTSALEPIMIVFMGIVVGGIMIAVMLPLYKMSELIK